MKFEDIVMKIVQPFIFDFKKPSNKDELLPFLGVRADFLNDLLKNLESPNNLAKKSTTTQIYTVNLTGFIQHKIPKKGKNNYGEYRVVWETYYYEYFYKALARRFDLFLSSSINEYPHSCSFGYVRGRNTINNAMPHCGKYLILHADIKNFFPSITSKKLNDKFIEIGIKDEVAKILTSILTIEGSLPLGLSTSPMLANLMCLTLDKKLSELAKQYDCDYTRYADDITISGHKETPKKEEIEQILSEEGFLLSERKFRITKMGQAHFVTGLSVTDKNMPRIPKAMKRKLRQELYFCKKHGVKEHLNRGEVSEYGDFQTGINRLDGMVRYVANIEKKTLPNLRSNWNDILNKNKIRPSYKSLGGRDKDIVIYVDETELCYNEEKNLALAFVIFEKSDFYNTNTISILNDYLIDPFSGGKKDIIKKKKMHYADANEDLRKKYINFLSKSDFNCYISYLKLSDNSEYENTYIKLLSCILPHRFMGLDGCKVSIILEENSKVSSKKINDAINKIYTNLNGNRRPINQPSITIGQKADHLEFAMPDFMLGVWGDYIKKQDKEGDRHNLLFEQLRDKYRIISDLNRGIIFTRKKRFEAHNI